MQVPTFLRRFWQTLLVLPALLLVSCDDDNLPYLPSFYMEMGSAYNPLDRAKELTLSTSGLNYFVYEDPVVPPWYVTNVELVKVQNGQLALRFYFDRDGNRELYRNSVTNIGRMIVTVVDGKAIGARQIDGPLQGGVFYTFTELTEEELVEMVPKMQESIKKLNQMKNEEGL